MPLKTFHIKYFFYQNQVTKFLEKEQHKTDKEGMISQMTAKIKTTVQQ